MRGLAEALAGGSSGFTERGQIRSDGLLNVIRRQVRIVFRDHSRVCMSDCIGDKGERFTCTSELP